MNLVEFILLVEKEGMIEQIIDYVIDNVFRDLGDYLVIYVDCYVFINLLVFDFYMLWLIV